MGRTKEGQGGECIGCEGCEVTKNSEALGAVCARPVGHDTRRGQGFGKQLWEFVSGARRRCRAARGLLLTTDDLVCRVEDPGECDG